MSERKHPGTITYVDEENGTEWSKPAADAPEAMRFAGDIPVVRAVKSAIGTFVEIHEFGPNGELLRSTTAFRDPPPEPKHPGTVTYIDEAEGTEWTKPADQLPKDSRFEGDIPVVKVILTAGEKMLIQAYGPDGELLRSTEGVRRPRPSPALEEEEEALSELEHPGIIEFVDYEKGTQWWEPANTRELLPFHGDIPVFHRPLPVVRVTISANSEPETSVRIDQFAPDGELVMSYTAFRAPPTELKHPGVVDYVDEEKGTEWTEPADELPASSRFHGDIPITRVVFTAGEKRLIEEYGPDLQLLRYKEGVR